MKKVNIIVACGSGVATSTLAADEVKDLCKDNNIQYSLNKCSMTELPTMSQNADIVLTTNNFKGELDVPVMSIMGFVTGINEEKLKANLLEKLKEIQNS
ncbi:PTS sugar transporter subunit IIB [Enterococcus alishanensis]